MRRKDERPGLLRLISDESGAAMTEYMLVAVLVVVALIAAYQYYGHKLQGKWIGAGNKLYGATDDTCVVH